MSLPEMLIEPVNKLLVPVASSAGQTLQDAWELAFGGFGSFVEKKRAERMHNVEAFKKSLQNEVAAIPADQVCEPKLSVIGPALEASKYYLEEPELREMFAKLIASSMNTDTSELVHPSFTEIIKQMTPLDAQILVEIQSIAPIAEYLTSDPDGGLFTAITNVFLNHPTVKDEEKTSISITSLARLGLVSVDYTKRLEKDLYTKFEQTPFYKDLQAEIQNRYPNLSSSVHPGVVQLTPLGHAFKAVCLN